MKKNLQGESGETPELEMKRCFRTSSEKVRMPCGCLLLPTQILAWVYMLCTRRKHEKNSLTDGIIH